MERGHKSGNIVGKLTTREITGKTREYFTNYFFIDVINLRKKREKYIEKSAIIVPSQEKWLKEKLEFPMWIPKLSRWLNEFAERQTLADYRLSPYDWVRTRNYCFGKEYRNMADSYYWNVHQDEQESYLSIHHEAPPKAMRDFIRDVENSLISVPPLPKGSILFQVQDSTSFVWNENLEEPVWNYKPAKVTWNLNAALNTIVDIQDARVLVVYEINSDKVKAIPTEADIQWTSRQGFERQLCECALMLQPFLVLRKKSMEEDVVFEICDIEDVCTADGASMKSKKNLVFWKVKCTVVHVLVDVKVDSDFLNNVY